LDAILAVADGIMVARGDLGVEVPPEQVPAIQKYVIRRAGEFRKPVITATQMLESMVRNPRPTRAETSDVANAIVDGTDAVMLSAETASGDYPVEAVETMVRIARDVESADFWSTVDRSASTPSIAQAVAESACRAATSLGAKTIAVFTQSGSTAALISRFRPHIPIIAYTASASWRTCTNRSCLWSATCCRPVTVRETSLSSSWGCRSRRAAPPT
jgi:pyruvate kinase